MMKLSFQNNAGSCRICTQYAVKQTGIYTGQKDLCALWTLDVDGVVHAPESCHLSGADGQIPCSYHISVVSVMVISPFIFIYNFKETYVDLSEVTIFKFTE